MFATGLHCLGCGQAIPLGLHYTCPACGGILKVAYDYEAMAGSRELRACLGSPAGGTGMWRYRPLLPVRDQANIVSLGEGDTPLLPTVRLGRQLGVPGLMLKMEGANPTASFKDRPTSAGIGVAKEQGAERVIIASSGNAGAATAAYAARAGLPCLVVVPEGTPSGKVAQTLSTGARVVFTRGSYSNAYKLARDAAAAFGWANLSSTFLNPFTVEGDKTVAYELWQQLGRRVPDWIIVPIGAGPLLVGTCRGFEELRHLGLTDRLPAMIGVQSEGVHPVSDAFDAGETMVREWHQPTGTVSTGIADPLIGYPGDGTLTLAAIRSTGGHCLMAPDAATVEMGRRLAEAEGIFVEPTAATGIYAAAALRDRSVLGRDDLVVALLTGHGLKTPAAYLGEVPEPPVVDSPEAVREMLGGSD